jgi:seryl-tRNA synthetase
MLDIKFIRKNPKKVKKGCRDKQAKIDINAVLDLDKKKREILLALEDLRAKKNQASKDIIAAKNEKDKRKIILQMRELDKNNDQVDEKFKEIEKEFNKFMLQIPNLPSDDVLSGKDEKDNKVLRKIAASGEPMGDRPKFDFKSKDYMELAENLDLIDIKRAAKVAGSRFGYLKNQAVLLEFALINLVFEILLKEGFIPVIPPVMLKSKMAQGTGYFEATDIKEAYFLPKDDLFLVGTSEQSLLTMRADEILEEKELPNRYVGFSTCFRRESGSYGKDTKGILRVHQFDKLEMFSFCKPEQSAKELQFFLEMEEKLMQALKLPYQVLNICTGDLGFPAATKYDIEAWIPSENRYRETHSTSNCTDFQARRLNIRYKNSKTQKLEFVHTVNGTAFAIGRTLIAIIENYQQKDGSILVPQVLQKYLGFNVISQK